MELYNGRIVCPLCDGEGIVEPILIKKLNLRCYACDECDATWFKIEDIDKKPCEEFSLLMEKHGLEPVASEVTNLDYGEITKQLIALKLLPEQSLPPT